MSSSSTPKRIFGSIEDVTQSETTDSQLKRTRIDGSFTSGSDSEVCWGAPCGAEDSGVQSAVPLLQPHRSTCFLPPPSPYQNFTPQNTLQFPSRNGLPANGEHGLQGIQRTQSRRPVCFGMLRNIEIRIESIHDPQFLSFDEIHGETGIFVSLELSMQDDRCDILTHDKHIATMNCKTHYALSSLRLPGSPTWVGVMSKTDLQDKLIAATAALSTGSSKITCTMSILVTGHSSMAQALAKELGRHHLFLQHPEPRPKTLEYDNPQFLSLVGAPCLDRPILPPILGLPNNQHDETNSNCLVEYGADSIEAVFDNLSQDVLQKHVDIDGRIQTRLESHQREAVAFILSRESPHSQQKNNLWRLDTQSFGEPVYKHIITGARSSDPVCVRGGILADDMGVGKSLSMLASIVHGISNGHTPLVDGKTNQNGFEQANMLLIPAMSTLVIVPSVLLLKGWIDEIEKHVKPGGLTYYKYHGNQRSISLSSSPPYHIVFSTYATVEADFSRSGGTGVLNRFHWHKLILDEAHVIRNSSTKQFKAIASLSASIRWCMTGTPIQNSLDDLASLVRFLRVPQLDNPVAFRKHVTKGSVTARGVHQADYSKLKLLLTAICLRRKMSTVFPSLGGSFITHRLPFSEAERKVYDELVRACDRQFKAVVNAPSSNGENKLILTAKLRLRMFCNTGLRSLFLGARGDSDVRLSSDEVVAMLQQSGQNVCSICSMEILSSSDDNCVSPEHWLDFARVLKCQGCANPEPGVASREVLRDSTAPRSDEDNEDEDMKDVQPSIDWGKDSDCALSQVKEYPSKLLALLADIQEHHAEEKSIIFSFWRQSLDLVGQMLHGEGIPFCRVDGIMGPMQRHAALERFRRCSSVRVLLMTIGTGAVGLNNLSVASRIHILEPQWNPSVENQAIGRALRWGQDKTVVVIRYIMKGTVEEMIENGQMRKMQLSLNNGELR